MSPTLPRCGSGAPFAVKKELGRTRSSATLLPGLSAFVTLPPGHVLRVDDRHKGGRGVLGNLGCKQFRGPNLDRVQGSLQGQHPVALVVTGHCGTPPFHQESTHSIEGPPLPCAWLRLHLRNNASTAGELQRQAWVGRAQM